MKIYSRISVSTLSVLFLVAGAMAKAPRAAAQTGSVQFVARVTLPAAKTNRCALFPSIC
jgi:hypothetical protein